MSSDDRRQTTDSQRQTTDGRRSSAVGRPSSALAPLLIFFAAIALWEGAIRVFDIPQFLLPAPSRILQAVGESWQIVLSSAGATFRSALIGFLIGCGGGILAALATSRWTTLREGLMPLAIAVNSVPILAFAPILNNWLGTVNPASKIAIVAIITFFPMMINMVRGLTLVEPAKLELMRSLASRPSEVLTKVRLPNALPYLFNALKVCSTLAVIGAIVGEYFGGPRGTLGVYILQEAKLFRFPEAWAAILVASLLGIGFYLLIIALERWLIPWHASNQQP